MQLSESTVKVLLILVLNECVSMHVLVQVSTCMHSIVASRFMLHAHEARGNQHDNYTNTAT